MGARVRLAHADREVDLAARDAGKQLLALRLGAEAQQQRPGLAVGGPGRPARRPRDQQLLGDDIKLERTSLVAALALRPRHAHPTLGADPPPERGGGAPAETAP